MGTGGDQSAIIQLHGWPKATALGGTHGCPGVQHDPVATEVELKALCRLGAGNRPNTEGRLEVPHGEGEQ